MPGTYLVDGNGNPIDASNPLPVVAELQSVTIGGVTIANGADATQGAKADVAVQDASSSASTIALLKGIQAILGLVTASPTSNTVNDRLKAINTALAGTLIVDTELLAATAMADATANPTITQIASYLMGFNGSTFDRVRLDANKNVVVSLRNSSGGEPTITISISDNDTFGHTVIYVANKNLLYNETGYDKQRGNTNLTIFSSAARTADPTPGDKTNYNAKGIHVVLDVTNAGTGSITLTIQGKDSVSGQYYTILAGAAVSSNSTNVYKVFRGAPVTANVSANDIIPRTFRIIVTHNNANSITYSVGASLIL